MSVKNDETFQFLKKNRRDEKPREQGLTEIRGPYYSVMGKRYLKDILETMGPYVDSLKFAGGSFSLMPEKTLTEILELCHEYDTLVSTGGFAEYVLTQGEDAFVKYVEECERLGFDIIELSAGFISLSNEDWLRMIEVVQEHGLKAKPEIGIQFGAGGGVASSEDLEKAGTLDVGWAIDQAKTFVEAGAYLIMVESEGITENVDEWRTDVPAEFANEVGIENVMFEAAEPEVFSWYVKNYGPEVNVFIDHSQIVQLECLRRGIWGSTDLWGRVQSFK
jgi:phosphosulfolactate synthase (CoM biosynthesis protein A)